MRITADEKAATRKRILTAAKALFRSKGFQQATTRDIAREVGMATGTLFNYFSSKEAIVIDLAIQSLGKAKKDFARHRNEQASLEEDLVDEPAGHHEDLGQARLFLHLRGRRHHHHPDQEIAS